MAPSVGRVVHYVSFGSPGGEFESTCRAAMITDVGGLVDARRYPNREISTDDEVADLAVFQPEGVYFAQGVLHDEQHSAGTWHWPERVG